MGLEDAAGRRLAPGGHAAAACPDPGPSAAWRDEPAARLFMFNGFKTG